MRGITASFVFVSAITATLAGQCIRANGQEVIIREYTSVEDPGNPGDTQTVSAEVYVLDQATGQKRTITTLALNGENDLQDASYNPHYRADPL
jgi:hypothetical protein